MGKDDYMLAGAIGLVVLFGLIAYVVAPVVDFINYVPGGWVIFAVMVIGGRVAYVKRDTEYVVDRTIGLRKFLEKVTFGKYIYCRTFW